MNEGWSYLATIILQPLRNTYYNLCSVLMPWHLGTLGGRPRLYGIRLLLANRASTRGKSYRNSMNLSMAKTYPYFWESFMYGLTFPNKASNILCCLILQAGTLRLLKGKRKRMALERVSSPSPFCQSTPGRKGWTLSAKAFHEVRSKDLEQREKVIFFTLRMLALREGKWLPLGETWILLVS